MKLKIIILSQMILFIFSCSTRNEHNIINIDNIPVKFDLNGTTVNIPVSMLLPVESSIVDDKLIVIDNVKKELLKVFKLPDLEYMFCWGNVGKGPNEFISINQQYFRGLNNELELMDANLLKRLEVFNNSMSVKSILKLPLLENPLNNLQKISDSIYVADNLFTDNKFEHIMFNIKNGNIIKKFGKYPDEGIIFKENYENYQIYSKASISCPNRGKFIVFYYYFGKIKIYDNYGNLQKSIAINDIKVKDFLFENIIKQPVYFSFPYATENYFYVIRMNKTENDIVNDLESYKPELLIWDWDGNPLAICKLDKPITDFSVSEKFKKIYGICIMKENEIYAFDLPDL